MKPTIEIDGKEYDVKGTVRESGGFGILTTGGKFWMKPCRPHKGQSSFWMGENGFKVDLPSECPQRISRITFNEPDLTDQFPDEVKADYRAYKTHCKKSGDKMLSFEQYKSAVAVSNIWKRHETPELVAQYGYIDDPFVLYSQNLEGQKIDPACLHKFKWAAEYMDQDGQGDVVFFARLPEPDPLPESLRGNESDIRETVCFSNGFKQISCGLLTVDFRARHLTPALQYIYEHREDGWLPWEDVVAAAGHPAWSNKRPKVHLIANDHGDKKKIIEAIIEEDGSYATSFKVKLNEKYQFKAE